MNNQSRDPGVRKRGRPKRDPRILSELIAWEREWQIRFSVLREGAPHADDSFPDLEAAGLKWFGQMKSEFVTADERRFWQKHADAHAKEAEEEFTRKMVLAEPRDIPAEPEFWKLLSHPLYWSQRQCAKPANALDTIGCGALVPRRCTCARKHSAVQNAMLVTLVQIADQATVNGRITWRALWQVLASASRFVRLPLWTCFGR